MRKLTFEISTSAVQATFACLMTLVIASALMWAYAKDTAANSIGVQSEVQTLVSERETSAETPLDRPTGEQAGADFRVETRDETKIADNRSAESGAHPKSLIGPLATNLVNLVSRFRQESREEDRRKSRASAARSLPAQ